MSGWSDVATVASTVLALASAGTTVVVYIALTRERVERLSEHEKRIDEKIDSALKELRESTTAIKLLSVQQVHTAEDGEDLRIDLRRAMGELQELIVSIRTTAAEQAVINRVTSELLSTLTRKQEDLETRLNDTSGSVTLMGELLKAKGITGH